MKSARWAVVPVGAVAVVALLEACFGPSDLLSETVHYPTLSHTRHPHREGA